MPFFPVVAIAVLFVASLLTPTPAPSSLVYGSPGDSEWNAQHIYYSAWGCKCDRH